MSNSIHPSSVIDPKAHIGKGVEIGPFCHVGANVVIRDNTQLVSQVSVLGNVEIGEDCLIHPFAALGSPAQDFKDKGGAVSLKIGDRNIIREHVTMHMGTENARGKTTVGDDGYFMVGAHVGHDCAVGDHAVFANNATLGGEVTVGHHVIMGGLSAIHQKCRVGNHSFIGGGAPVTGDVIPYGMVDNHGYLAGLNLVGLKRRGFKRDTIHELRAAYRMIFASEGKFTERVEDAARLFNHIEEAAQIISFIQAPAARPLCTPESS